MQCGGLHLVQAGARLDGPTSLTEAGLVTTLELTPVHSQDTAEGEEEQEGYHALHHS